jgi:hypothetical protein
MTTTQTQAKTTPATVKPRTTRKPTAAKTTPAITTPATKQGYEAIAHYLSGSRPGSGTKLASYSRAWMEIAGMDKGAAVPRTVVLALAGSTALGYHLKDTKSFEETADGKGIILTSHGKDRFFGTGTNRNIKPAAEMVEAYKAVFLKGETPEAKAGTGINKSNIAVFKAA